MNNQVEINGYAIHLARVTAPLPVISQQHTESILKLTSPALGEEIATARSKQPSLPNSLSSIRRVSNLLNDGKHSVKICTVSAVISFPYKDEIQIEFSQ